MTTFELYRYKKLGLMQNGRKPQNTHLIIETTSYGIYFVDSADNTKLYKTTDEGVTVSQVDVDPGDASGDNKSRMRKIQVAWHDKTNNRIWFVDCDNDGADNQFDVWYITTTTDVVTDVDSDGIGGRVLRVSDVFIIGATTYALVQDMGLEDLYIADVTSAPIQYPFSIGGDTYNIMYGIVDSGEYYGILDDDGGGNVYFYDYDEAFFTIHYGGGIAGYTIPVSSSLYGVSFDGVDTIYFIAKKNADGKNYLCTCSISTFVITDTGVEYNIALMLDRNTLGTAGSPWEFEKAFHITSSYVYQIHRAYANLAKIGDLALSDEWYPGLPDDFNLETVGTSGTDIAFVDVISLPNSCTLKIITEIDDHNNIIELYNDGAGSESNYSHDFPGGNEPDGTREFWWGSSDVTKSSFIQFQEGGSIKIILLINAGFLQYYEGGVGYHNVKAISNNILYHCKIIFDCVTDTYDIWVDEVLIDANQSFNGTANNLSRVKIRNTSTAVYYQYLDAWGDPADAGYTVGDNLTALTNVIIAITDKYLITSYPVYLYEYTESIADFPRARATYGIYRTPRAEFTYQTSLSTDQLIEIYENASGTYTKAFSGRAGLPKYNNNKAQYDFNSINFGEDDLNRDVSKTVSAAGLDETVIAIVNDNSNYIYTDSTSVPNIAINVTYTWELQRLRDCLYTLAILANGYWFYGPTGYLYFRIYSNAPASGDTFSQSTGSIGPPRTRKLQNQFNTWIIYGGINHATGAPFDKTETDDAHILQYGELVWTGRDTFPEARSQAALNAIATGLKAWQGMQDNPDEAASLITGKYYYPVGYSASYQFTHLAEFLTAQTMLIAGVRIDFKSRGMIDTAFSTNIMRRQ